MTQENASSISAKPTAAESWRMFDRIARRYDVLNRLLSMRRDVAWRRAIEQALPAGEELRVLDLATGTGDVVLGLARGRRKIQHGIGLDRSSKMLALARKKATQSGGRSMVDLVRGDAGSLGIRSGALDAVTMAFGIRNVPNVTGALREIRRVLKPGGRALILEFSLPGNPVVRSIYLAYFRHVLPRIGGWISGDPAAYRYLNESVEHFPSGEAFLGLMRKVGFERVNARPLTFGIATLYQGDR